jgi:hypothetical protein
LESSGRNISLGDNEFLQFDDPLYRILEEEAANQSNNLDNISTSDLRFISQFTSPPPELWISCRIFFLVIMLLIRSYSPEAGAEHSRQTSSVSGEIGGVLYLIMNDQIFRKVLLCFNAKDVSGLRKIDNRSFVEQFSWPLFRELLESDFVEPLMSCFWKQLDDSQDNDHFLIDGSWMYHFADQDLQLLREMCRPQIFSPESCVHISLSAAKFTKWTRRAVASIYHSFVLKGSCKLSADAGSLSERVKTSWLESNAITSSARVKEAFSQKHFHSTLIDEASYTLCLRPFSGDTRLVSVAINLASAHSNLDIFLAKQSEEIVENDFANESALHSLKDHLRVLSLAPSHQVIDGYNHSYLLERGQEEWNTDNFLDYSCNELHSNVLILSLSTIQSPSSTLVSFDGNSGHGYSGYLSPHDMSIRNVMFLSETVYDRNFFRMSVFISGSGSGIALCRVSLVYLYFKIVMQLGLIRYVDL